MPMREAALSASDHTRKEECQEQREKSEREWKTLWKSFHFSQTHCLQGLCVYISVKT